MSIDGQTFFEARKHVGSSGFVLYVHEERDAPRDRKDFATKEELLDYLSAFDLSVTPQQIIIEMSGPPQKDSNPPGRKFIFTGRRRRPMSNESQAEKPVVNYNIRASQDGLWLWTIEVSKGGVPFRVTDWAGVAAQANQYDFRPQFLRDESSAWIGSLSAARNIQRVLAERCNIIADIYDRGSHGLVSKG